MDPNDIGFGQMMGLIGGGQAVAPPAPVAPPPQQQMAFGPLMAILMEQARRKQQPVQQDPRYQAGYAAADAFLRRSGQG